MRKLLNFIDRHSSKLFWLMIILYGLFFSAVSIWKYNHFLYNGLDLAIINNVFYNTLHGHWFWSSIQGHSYLGDHFTPILVLLLPFYALWPSPEFLLILQTFFLALAAWPLYKIAQLILKDNRLALGMALLWLINPLVHNANLFEFHFIALLPFLFFSLFYYYLQLKARPGKKIFLSFLALALLCLMLREDIVFIILLFLTLTTLSHLKHKQMLRLLGYGWLMALGWLVVSSLVIKHFSPSGSSPFIYYYSWLLSTNWLNLIQHIFSLANLKMLIGFLLPFLFIPLIRPRWLWLALVPLGQIIFSAHGGGVLVWKLHYGLLFMPALVIAFIYGFKQVNRLLSQWLGSRSLLMIILIISNFYLWIDLGPLTLDLKQFNFNPPSVEQLVRSIPRSAVVLSSYDFLPNLSGRREIYALNYYFLGQQQFASQPYILAHQPDYIFINFHDLIGFQLQFPQSAWAEKYYQAGAGRLRRLLADYGAIKVAGDTVLFKKNYPSQFNLYKLAGNSALSAADKGSSRNFNNQIKISRFKLLFPGHGQARLSLSLYVLRPPRAVYQLKINLSDGRHNYHRYLPLAYGLYPTDNWRRGDLIKLNYWLELPDKLDIKKITQADLSLVKLEGTLALDKLGVVKLNIDQEQIIGRTIGFKVD